MKPGYVTWKIFGLCVSVFVITILLGRAANAIPLESTVEFDGHRYFLAPHTGLAWDQAQRLAAAQTVELPSGTILKGHLVTINNQAEQDFVSGTYLTANFQQLWLGGYQYLEGGGNDDNWAWVTGEEAGNIRNNWSYNFLADTEPENGSTTGIPENVLRMLINQGTGTPVGTGKDEWADFPDFADQPSALLRTVIEFDEFGDRFRSLDTPPRGTEPVPFTIELPGDKPGGVDSGDVPSITEELANYIAGFTEPGVREAPVVGFNGMPLSAELTGFDFLRYTAGDVGDKFVGNGIDELVAFSFDYPSLSTGLADGFSSIESAILKLTLTPMDSLVTTDLLFFADNDSTSAQNFGNEIFKDLVVGQEQTVVFDLAQMPGANGFTDLRPFLRDGTLNVLYGDDAIIHSVRLELVASRVPEPATIGLFGICLAALGWWTRRRTLAGAISISAAGAAGVRLDSNLVWRKVVC